MRLDVLLVRKGYFSSRQKAKECIKRGFVKVNGEVIRKPSFRVREDSEIEVLFREVPRGYWKLKEIDERMGLFSGDEIVLDLGSSAGGFLLYASERSRYVIGIEFSENFRDELKRIEEMRENVRVFIADAFSFDIENLPEFDLILNDLTLPFSSSILALRRFLKKLKKGGRVLFVHKTGDGEMAEFPEFEVLSEMTSEDRKEKYYLLRPLDYQPSL
ncbi:MAG: rRNA (cytidine1920-2-O)/16S rRNA (cytidine1409-2-O)-methyltransferase [Archaeoglobi archaeon]|nr:rRNA (cytidine1920-2-O)/16S rRNA (cytidine1409-2-O)-methyltransferase [Archaeoglobi archaeon]